MHVRWRHASRRVERGGFNRILEHSEQFVHIEKEPPGNLVQKRAPYQRTAPLPTKANPAQRWVVVGGARLLQVVVGAAVAVAAVGWHHRMVPVDRATLAMGVLLVEVEVRTSTWLARTRCCRIACRPTRQRRRLPNHRHLRCMREEGGRPPLALARLRCTWSLPRPRR